MEYLYLKDDWEHFFNRANDDWSGTLSVGKHLYDNTLWEFLIFSKMAPNLINYQNNVPRAVPIPSDELSLANT